MKALAPLPFLLFSGALIAADQAHVRRAVAEGRLRPLTEIIAQVQARYPGRILDVELERDRNGNHVYEIEMLGPDRRRFELKVDGVSGEVITPGGGTRMQGGLHPLPDLLRQVLQAHPGHVIDVEFEKGLYQVEVVRHDGRHVKVFIDPRQPGVPQLQPPNRLDQVMSMAEVLDAILARYPGMVLDAELERSAGGAYYYEVEIEDSRGRTVSLRADAFSGEILHEEEED